MCVFFNNRNMCLEFSSLKENSHNRLHSDYHGNLSLTALNSTGIYFCGSPPANQTSCLFIRSTNKDLLLKFYILFYSYGKVFMSILLLIWSYLTINTRHPVSYILLNVKTSLFNVHVMRCVTVQAELGGFVCVRHNSLLVTLVRLWVSMTQRAYLRTMELSQKGSFCCPIMMSASCHVRGQW